MEDRWFWLLEPTKGYRVSGVYHLLSSLEPGGCSEVTNIIWHKVIPLKVTLFAWRLFRNRLSMKDNLFLLCVILIDYQLCAKGCGTIESVDHLLLGCVFFPV